MTNNKKLEQYIKNWNKLQGVKPENEDVFIDMFIVFLSELSDEQDIQFDGKGSYFGKQVTIDYNSSYRYRSLLKFEIAYSVNQIRVYTGNNNGYWQPEYICMSSDHARFNELNTVFRQTLLRLFGLD